VSRLAFIKGKLPMRNLDEIAIPVIGQCCSYFLKEFVN